ncbi:hypothetical protein CARUB_v10006694mg [Capsella rubella]|uniref:Uncharacterized protein n=1 Tax=Capsella rubella TaxID=81985 RepID=R0GMT5_9BRAS|nr:hypothetical protein CARUB_v10006694mg [Capsella rubella]
MAKKSCESVHFFLFFFVISFNAISVSAQTCDNTTGTFEPDNPYDKNRRLILSTLATNVTALTGYYFNGSIGIAPDEVYTIGMCAPASEDHVCSLCIKTTSESLLQNCPNQADAFSWSGEETLCLVRYSNRPISGLLNMTPRGAIYNTGELNTNQTEFDIVWTNLTSSMITGITSSSSSSGANNSSKYYSDGLAPVPDFKNISAMMQCTPDVSTEDCRTCLRTNVDDYGHCCRKYQGGVISRPNCFFRWETYSFDGATDQINLPKSPPPSITTSPVANITKNGKIAESVQFDLKTIESATSNFSEHNKLGKGGFGEVYKGMLMNGTEIAVKRLSKTSGQGEVEFKNEVVVVAKLQHINLVRLLGFSLQGEEKLLVYEFVPNKSLDYFLFDPMMRTQLDWTMRRNIIGGITRGILYLHQDSRLKIIHRDLKASNILLDADMNPKISDFGMARIFGMDQTVANTARVVGTFGYMSPEYVTHGQFSMKSDVYSFGVLILEIISGKKNSSFYQMDGLVNNLVTYVWRLWENKSLHDLIDPSIIEDCKHDEVVRYIHIGLLCVQENPTERPTMSTIHQMLTTSSIALPVPLPPGFFFRNEQGLNPLGQRLEPGQSTSKSFACSVDEATITEVNPR